MAIASFLRYTDASLQYLGGTVGVNKISNATPEDLAFYDRSAYRRMEQVTTGGQDDLITLTLFPKASIELLNMFEFGWWPQYVEKTLGAFYYRQAPNGMTMTAFDPSKLVKVNQTLVQLEVYKSIEIFYGTLVTDNSNINEKDKVNLNFARKRFEEEWAKAVQESYFYDLKSAGFIGTYQQNWLADVNSFEGDRRYF
jgi:hypothetical protein